MSGAEIDAMVEEAEEAVDDFALATLPRNDVGNGERFMARNGRDVRETQRFGRFVWDERRWVLDDGGVAMRRKAQLTAKAMVERELEALKEAGETEKGRAGFFKYASSCANSARLSNMIEEALAHLQHPIDRWNAQPHLFNTPNGTLDLSDLDMKLLPHRREHYITCMAGVAYDPNAKCPTFKATLEKCLPDKPVRDFVQRYFGASMVDSSGDQGMVIHHGGGANGKSTITDAIAHAMGTYAVTTDVGVLLHSDAKASGGGPQPSLIKLANGARLVRAAEPELGMRLSESLIKQLTGGEPMEVRDMYEKPIEFIPRFKISLSCNARPPIRGGDHGIWRRLMLVPWHVQIAAEERDADLPEKLRAETAGILNWLLDGWSDWHEGGGLRPPPEVLSATEEYRQDSDPVGRFLAEWCTMDAGERIEANELHQAFEAWCGREQMKVLPLSLFGRRLTDRGIEKWETGGKTYRKGYRLTEAAVAAVETAKQAKLDKQFDRELRRGRGRLSDDPPE
jgi:putative DNA primase/helicase